MGRRPRPWMRKLAWSVLLAFAATNVLAFFHAGALTRFIDADERTPRPEELSLTQKASVLLRGVRVGRPENSRTPDQLGLTYETHRFANADGIELEAWHVAGDSGVLWLLFHGYAASKASLVPIAKELRELGHAALLVDFYGSGGSAGAGTSIGYHEAGDVAAADRYARATWPESRRVLYGHSMGAAAVLGAVARGGVEPDGLVLEAVFDSLLHAVQSRFRAMGLPATPLAHLLVFWGGVRSGFDGFAHRPRIDARAVSCPALVLLGEQDARVTIEQARAVCDELSGWKRLSLYPEVAHQPTFHADQPRWRSDVRELVRQIRAE